VAGGGEDEVREMSLDDGGSGSGRVTDATPLGLPVMVIVDGGDPGLSQPLG
jgi:hypothetical protein